MKMLTLWVQALKILLENFYKYKNNLFFRLGIFQRGTFSSGIGLFWNDFSIDYAFLNDGSLNGIKKNHLLSVSVSLDWIKKQFKNKI